MKHPRRSLASRVVPFLVIYLFGAATSAALLIAGDDAPDDLVQSSADAAPLPSLARRVEASREAPPAPAPPEPAGLRVAPVVFSLRGAPLVLEESSRILPDPSESGAVPFASYEATSDRDVESPPRLERAVTTVTPRRPLAPPQQLDAAQIRGALAAHMPSLRRCYERVGRRQGDAREERLRVDLRIARGGVRSASVSGASNVLLQQCVSTAVRGWRFPQGSAEVSLPVRLRPREG